jgi:hypothetical protein
MTMRRLYPRILRLELPQDLVDVAVGTHPGLLRAMDHLLKVAWTIVSLLPNLLALLPRTANWLIHQQGLLLLEVGDAHNLTARQAIRISTRRLRRLHPDQRCIQSGCANIRTQVQVRHRRLPLHPLSSLAFTLSA